LIKDRQFRHGRTLKIVRAIEANTSFALTDVEKFESINGDVFELIGVILTCDGVPDESTSGILYKEALTIKVGDNSFVPEVWPVRKDFPKMLHMTASSHHPSSLCLYLENDDAVNRNWTAQQFLARIYWWMEHSSKGTLHSDEQAVEQLFYTTKYELVLPHNFTTLIKMRDVSLYADFVNERANGGYSLVLSNNKAHEDSADNERYGFKVFTVQSASVKQDFILSLPHDIATLFSLPRGIGSTVENQLKEQIQHLCGDNGAVDDKKLCTIILLVVPLYRNDEGKVERYHNLALLLEKSPYHLGLEAKFLLCSPESNKFFIDRLCGYGPPSNASTLRALKLYPMEVTKLNTDEEFAYQSNNEFSSEWYTLIGLGALGSSLFDFWLRSGWGHWNLFDKDHVKPHNLTRHTACRYHIGMNKATAAKFQARNILGHTDYVRAFEEDGMRLSSPAKAALQQSSLVIDASTSLDYPRKASFDDTVARHLSVFVSPSGNDSVILLEERTRKIRLRTIEAQYYRLLINKEWGKTNLNHHQ